jgi:hypothetical protein
MGDNNLIAEEIADANEYYETVYCSFEGAIARCIKDDFPDLKELTDSIIENKCYGRTNVINYKYIRDIWGRII